MINFIKPEFKNIDSRGYLYQLFSDTWKQVNLLYSKINTFRGDHYHKENKEVFFLISGKCKLKLINMITEEEKIINIKEKDMFIINPYIKHSFYFTEDTIMIAAYSKGYLINGIEDIYK